MITETYLKLANGEILYGSTAGFMDDHLWLYLQLSMARAIQLATNEEALQTIESYYGRKFSVYEGFTKVNAIVERGRQIEVRLIGGHVVKEDELYEGDSSGDGVDVVSESSGSES